MITDIPEGTIVRMKMRGQYSYERIVLVPPANQRGEDKYAIQFVPEEDVEDKKSVVRAKWTDNGCRVERCK